MKNFSVSQTTVKTAILVSTTKQVLTRSSVAARTPNVFLTMLGEIRAVKEKLVVLVVAKESSKNFLKNV